jgi:hypothetical protein
VALIAALCLTPATASAEDKQMEERMGIDPVLHGIATVVASSSDGGKTIDPVKYVFCQIFASKITLADGTTIKVQKVFIFTDDSGKPGNGILFENGKMWIVTGPDQGGLFLIVMSDENANEFGRILVTIG